MATNAQFDVFINGGSTSVDDYRRAMAAPKSALPALTAVQKTVVKKLRVPADEYRRGVLAEQLGESRVIEQGKKLGEIVQTLLDEVGSGYHVAAVQAEMSKPGWVLRLANAERLAIAEIPGNVASYALESQHPGASGLLKKVVVASLGEVH